MYNVWGRDSPYSIYNSNHLQKNLRATVASREQMEAVAQM